MERRQISPQEKIEILEAYRSEGAIRCFVDNAPLTDNDEIEFHHIRPYSENGPTEVSNIEPVCREHHRRLGTLSLSEFRDRLQLEKLFEGSQQRWLDDLLAVKLGQGQFGQRIRYEINETLEHISLYFGDTQTRAFPLQICPSTQLRYFYAVLPIHYVRNDKELQPRPLEPNRLWELYRHLLVNTQLAPAVCRLVGNQILLFDGQHKSAAQVWAGRTQIDCRSFRVSSGKPQDVVVDIVTGLREPRRRKQKVRGHGSPRVIHRVVRSLRDFTLRAARKNRPRAKISPLSTPLWITLTSPPPSETYFLNSGP